MEVIFIKNIKPNILLLFISSLLLTSFWFLLVDGEFTSLIVGVVFIPMSILVSAKLYEKVGRTQKKHRMNFRKVPKFIIFFLYQSLKGGTSAAVRVFSFNMNLKPEFIHYPMKYLSPGLSMNLFLNVVSLLPGSVSVIKEPNGVLVHVLAVTDSTIDEIYECECIVGELFGLEMPTNTSNSSTKEAR